MKNVLFIEPTIRPIGVDYLSNKFSTFYASNGKEKTLIKMINENEIHALITRTETITANLIRSCPSLEVIGQHGVGVNNIDVSVATEEGVCVINVPDANFVSVAEHTMMSILALSKNLVRNHKEVKKNNWDFRDQVLPSEIADKNLFIIGFGNIGRRVAKLANAFNMKVFIYDPYITAGGDEVTVVDSLIAGLKIADYTTLHLPLMKSTEKMISEEEFNHMKEESYLINVSRGQIVDQKALLYTLQQNKIAGVQLDVLDKEPPDPNDPIFKLENVIFTPHIAGDTKEAKDRCSKILSEEVAIVLGGKVSKNIVNKEVFTTSKILGRGKNELRRHYDSVSNTINESK
ncbi:hydroxyacid dehydrogenase [Pseudalkalibacillus sp. A8]|uniref:hydroxyacid dehydrogenase n=1 Tax=Pseudalkalibacillus sp. A8 TaxID=3382641 RepID=UPI0038B60473